MNNEGRVALVSKDPRHKAPAIATLLMVWALLSATWIGSSLLLGQPAPASYGEMFDQPGTVWRQACLPMLIAGVLATVILWRMGWLHAIWRDGLDVPRAPWWMWIPVAAGVAFVVSVMVARIDEIGEHGAALNVALVCATVAVGYAEETIFRGMLLTGGRWIWVSELKAWAFSTVLFGLWHVPNLLLGAAYSDTLTQVPQTILMGGTIFYCARRVTRMLWPAMILHTLWDFVLL